MDYLTDPSGKRVDNPDLNWIFLQWIQDTYGNEWFWLNCNWWMNFALIGQKASKTLAIIFDNKKHYSSVNADVTHLGVYDFSTRPSEVIRTANLLMPLDLANPDFFPKLKSLVDEYTGG